jgi:hypothetical protein
MAIGLACGNLRLFVLSVLAFWIWFTYKSQAKAMKVGMDKKLICKFAIQ